VGQQQDCVCCPRRVERDSPKDRAGSWRTSGAAQRSSESNCARGGDGRVVAAVGRAMAIQARMGGAVAVHACAADRWVEPTDADAFHLLESATWTARQLIA
jgi:hypothetical protein